MIRLFLNRDKMLQMVKYSHQYVGAIATGEAAWRDLQNWCCLPDALCAVSAQSVDYAY